MEGKKEPEIVRKVEFDSRRKELRVRTTETRVAEIEEGKKLGDVVLVTDSNYNEEGIKQLNEDMHRDITNLEQAIKRGKESLGERPKSEEFKELEAHNKKQKRLQEVGSYRKNEADLEANQEKLKQIKKAQTELKDAVGTRLKF